MDLPFLSLGKLQSEMAGRGLFVVREGCNGFAWEVRGGLYGFMVLFVCVRRCNDMIGSVQWTIMPFPCITVTIILDELLDTW